MKFLVSCLIFSLVVFTSCFQKKHPDVDSFYTAKAKYDFPRIPLVKPYFMIYDKTDKKWFYDYPTSFLEYGMSPSNTDTIGIDKHYLYGYIEGGIEKVREYEKGMFVYLGKYGGMSYTEKPSIFKDNILLKIIDSTEKTFKIPNRWFVVNAKDSTRQVFLSKAKYDNFLKKNNISGKTYNTIEMNKRFLDTGILPWFPDSIKTKLSK